MPAQRIAMRRIREVLRLKDECALTYSQIARALGISKGSVVPDPLSFVRLRPYPLPIIIEREQIVRLLDAASLLRHFDREAARRSARQ